MVLGQTCGEPLAGIVKLSGTLTNLVISPTVADFGFDQTDNALFNVVAITTLAAGSLGALPSQLRSGRATRRRDAEYIEFDLGDKHCKGMIRKCYYDNGDTVNVVAMAKEDHYEVYAIAEPATQTITLYPHCVRGTKILRKKFMREWMMKSLGFGGVTFVGSIFMMYIQSPEDFQNSAFRWFVFSCIGAGVSLIVIWIWFWNWLEYRNELPFAKFAEIIFKVLDFPDPQNIDLNQYSNDSLGNVGVQYITFRYPSLNSTNSAPNPVDDR